MKCIYCGEELNADNVYCPHCGKATQIVPDYNLYEDDYFKEVLAQENAKKSQKKTNAAPVVTTPAGEEISSGSQEKTKEASGENRKKQKKIIVGVLATTVLLVVVLVISGWAIRVKHNNSFDYQVRLARQACEDNDLDKAVSCYKRAISLNPEDTQVRLSLAQLSIKRKDYEEALKQYREVVRRDSGNREAFGKMIEIYERKKDIPAILALSGQADESLQDLFADYMVEEPELSLKPGTFDEPQELYMRSSRGYEIFYTLDGSDPSRRGEIYHGPVELKENNRNYMVKAVCMNDRKIYSDVVSAEYQIRIPAPDTPIVTPDGGDFGVETTVTVTVPDGCSAYYTWDGSTPDLSSPRYTKPITIPEGNNILSVILVDGTTGLRSDVYKGNFIYYSEDYDEEQE